VTAFVQAPQGNLGPGFVSISNAFASRSMNKYFRTGLLLFTFSAKPTTLVKWLWNLHVGAVTFLLVFNLSFACWQTSKVHEMIKIVQFSFILNKY
jgi:hypothetical protein